MMNVSVASEYVCTFETTGVRIDTMKESEDKKTVRTVETVYRVKFLSPKATIFNQDGADHKLAVVHKGYLDVSGIFRATAVKTHEVVKTVVGQISYNVTQFTGEFFDLKIENRDDFPAKVYFDGFESEVISTGKCIEN